MNPSREPDPELIGLVARLRDQQLDPDGKRRLEERLRHEPEAREYCADCLQFDAEMAEALHPQPRLEWSETRRLIVSGDSSWEIQHNQSLSYGSQTVGVSRPNLRRWLWALSALLFAAVAVGFVLRWRPQAQPAPAIVALPLPVVLRNADFEATDLAYAPEGKNSALVDWQDYFTTGDASLAEIGRSSQGRIFAKSGRNVARLEGYGFLTQRLRLQDGSALLARPGMKIVVRGWACVESGSPPYKLVAAVRFVAGSHPGMIQYEIVSQELSSLTADGWQPFRMELRLPDDLNIFPSHVSPSIPNLPRLNLDGRELTLSLDARGSGVLLLDALAIEAVPKEQ